MVCKYEYPKRYDAGAATINLMALKIRMLSCLIRKSSINMVTLVILVRAVNVS
jgi:hypothetical protein